MGIADHQKLAGQIGEPFGDLTRELKGFLPEHLYRFRHTRTGDMLMADLARPRDFGGIRESGRKRAQLTISTKQFTYLLKPLVIKTDSHCPADTGLEGEAETHHLYARVDKVILRHTSQGKSGGKSPSAKFCFGQGLLSCTARHDGPDSDLGHVHSTVQEGVLLTVVAQGVQQQRQTVSLEGGSL